MSNNKNPRGFNRPKDGRGQGRGQNGGLRGGRKIGICPTGRIGNSQGQGRGQGQNRQK